MGPVECAREGSLAVVRLSRQHGNALDRGLVDALREAFARLGADEEVRGVLLGSRGKLFCPGLDLRELVAYDREAMAAMMASFYACVLEIFTCPKPVAAALRGSALAGGCVLALAADRRVLADTALIGLAEIRVGVPLPFAVAQLLRETVPPPYRDTLALEGRNFQGEEALRAGLAHEVCAEGEVEGRARAWLADAASREARAFARTKAYLRAAAVERMRAEDDARREEFLDAWFAPGTRARVQEIVERLARKESA